MAKTIISEGKTTNEAIEKGLKLGKITLITSVDSGSKQTYEKIKQVPCFDKVWQNMAKYAKTKNGLIRTKYVLIPGINDSLSEIKNFMKKTYDAGIRNIAFDIEDNWFKANRDKLIEELKDKDKKAYFICSLVLYKPDNTYINVEGKTYGTIIDEEKGDTSFGYDCIFLSDDLGKTFGEATSEEKNKISHIYRALIQLKDIIGNISAPS